VYELTETGRAIQPAIRELIRWGGRFLFPMRKGETFEPDWVLLALEAIARRTAVPQCRIGLRIPHPSGTARIHYRGRPRGDPHCQRRKFGDAAIEARFDVLLQILVKTICRSTRPPPRGGQDRGQHTSLRKLPSLFELRQKTLTAFARVSGRSRRWPVRCLGSPNDGTCR